MSESDTKPRTPTYYDDIRKMNFEKTISVAAISFFYFAACFIAHHYYRQPFWDFSVNTLIPALQSWPDWVHDAF